MAISVFSYNSLYPQEQHKAVANSVKKIFVFIV